MLLATTQPFKRFFTMGLDLLIHGQVQKLLLVSFVSAIATSSGQRRVRSSHSFKVLLDYISVNSSSTLTVDSSTTMGKPSSINFGSSKNASLFTLFVSLQKRIDNIRTIPTSLPSGSLQPSHSCSRPTLFSDTLDIVETLIPHSAQPSELYYKFSKFLDSELKNRIARLWMLEALYLLWLLIQWSNSRSPRSQNRAKLSFGD